MTRMYLSPALSLLVKIGLFFVECLIGLYNMLTFPMRKITFKSYALILLALSAIYAIMFYSELASHVVPFAALMGIFAVCLLAIRGIYHILNKFVSPRVAYLMNSPLGIPLNRYHRITNRV